MHHSIQAIYHWEGQYTCIFQDNYIPVAEWVEGILQVVRQPGEEGGRHGDLGDRDKVAGER